MTSGPGLALNPKLLFPLVLLGLLSASAPSASAQAHFEIVNLDPPGQGLNDPSAWTPSRGNAAITLGQARLEAMRFALHLWTDVLDSPIPIRVGVSFESLSGVGPYVTLGLGGPADVFRDFAGATTPGVWYPAALADKLAGIDLAPGDIDLRLHFNSDVDTPAVFGAAGFDYGIEGPPTGGNVRFVDVAMHETGHALGFITLVDPADGSKALGYDDAFLLHLVRSGASPEALSAMTDAQRLAALAAGPDLQWSGAAVAVASADLVDGVAAGGRVEMYAPSTVLSNLSASHFSPDVSPDELMETFYTGSQLRLSVARAALQDIGWGPPPGCETVPIP